MLFEGTTSKKLTGFVIWVPQLDGKPANVPDAASLVPDARVQHYWDSSDDLGNRYGIVLPTPGVSAWDVYMLYRPGILWSGAQPPKPDFWMHQLGVTTGPHLDPHVFAAHARQLLENT